MTAKQPTCRKCIFFGPDPEEKDIGYCHRYPPLEPSHFIRDKLRLPGYPRVMADVDWCGECKTPAKKRKTKKEKDNEKDT